MTALLAGIDWSSKAIHAALIPIDPDHGDPTTAPVTFRHEPLPDLQGDPTIRIRAAARSTRELLRSHWPDTLIMSAWIEEAYGRFRNSDRALLPIYGAIVAGVPVGVPVAGIRSHDWRKELGLQIGATSSAEAKAEAQTLVLDWLSDNTPADSDGTKAFRVPDEHEVDALCVALAARQILNREAAA